VAAHPDREETVLEALLTGTRDEQDAEVQALFAASPGLRQRFERMRRLAFDLDRIGAADRDLLADAVSRPSPLDGEARQLVERRRGPVRPFPFRLITAAAVLLGALLGVWLLRGRTADEDSTLGLRAREQWPVGPVHDYERFRWNLSLPPECVYVLRFFDDGGTLLFPVDHLTATEWRPDADRRRQMTARMQWQVEVQDLTGRTRDGIGPVTVYLQH